MSDNLALELLHAIRGDLESMSERLDEYGRSLSRLEIMMAGQSLNPDNEIEADAD